jgi:hypothetical protein
MKEKKRKESDENRNNCNEGMKEWEPYLPMVRRYREEECRVEIYKIE